MKSATEAKINNFDWARYKFLKYFEILKAGYLNSTAYFSNLFGRSIAVVIRVWIFTQLYEATYRASGSQEIGGLTVPMVVWTLMFAQSFQGATRPAVSKIINDEIKSGSVAYSVNRPYSYILFHYFSFLGKGFPNIIFNILVGGIVALALVGPVKIGFAGIALGLILLLLGQTLEFLISFIIGIIAFWIEDSTSISWIHHKAQIIFGGLILPIALFPASIQKIALLLPFSQLFYAPASLIVSFNFSIFQKFILIQSFWLVFFGALATILFHKGIKNVSINGG